MLFNSIPFFYFFILFFLLYWFVFNKKKKLQNLSLLLGSYFFYAYVDWRFLAFLITVSILNFTLGIYIAKKTKYRRFLLHIGLIQGVGGLVFFKYFNFFITSFNEALIGLNVNFNLQTLNIIIPLGISFFTFKTISYLLDVDKGKIKPSEDWVNFFTYLAFFPCMLAGPIDKAKTFLPQLEKKRDFDYKLAFDGLRQILWGLFKKIVIADNCANITSQIFDNYEHYPGSALLLGAFLYTIQIYADFSGYSDMAIGFSRLLGINVTKNFNYPFFAQNIADFWRKWHITLTVWLTEYVFTPLCITFRNFGKLGLTLAIIINFTICGIWHGANWNYALFGFLHGCYFIPLIITGKMNKKKKIKKDKLLPNLKELFNMFTTFTVIMLTFIVFKSETILGSFDYIKILFSESIFTIPYIPSPNNEPILISTLICIFVMIIIEWIGRDEEYAIAILGFKWYTPIRWAMYYSILVAILYFQSKGGNFIYMQF